MRLGMLVLLGAGLGCVAGGWAQTAPAPATLGPVAQVAGPDTEHMYRLPDGTAVHLVTAGAGKYLLVDAAGGLRAPGSGRAVSDTGAAAHLWTLTSVTPLVLDGLALEAADEPSWPAPLPVTVAPEHDPSMVGVGTGYRVFATGGLLTVRELASVTDGPAVAQEPGQRRSRQFALQAMPAWALGFTHNGDLWAPDVSYQQGFGAKGAYVLYFAASSFGSRSSGIGLATSETGMAGTFADSGSPVLVSDTCPRANAIDPALLVTPAGAGKPAQWLLTFGSFFSGIWQVPLDPPTGRLPDGKPVCTHLAAGHADGAIEGAYLYTHEGRFYLFLSAGACCRGAESTYHILVGRSDAPQGPFVDRLGTPLLKGGGTMLLGTHGDVIGPGGQTVLGTPAGDLLVYHFYDGAHRGRPTLGLNPISWTADGWPELR